MTRTTFCIPVPVGACRCRYSAGRGWAGLLGRIFPGGAGRAWGLGMVLVFWTACAQAGGGPQNVLLVVNGQSQSSLEIANEYQRLRNIPEGNVLYLPTNNTAAFYTSTDLRTIMTGNVFRTNVLWPVLNFVRGHGLTNQIDYLLYSADIPTRIDVRTEPGSSNSIIGTAYYSLTAMTAFGDLVEAVNTASNLSGNSLLTFRGNTYDAKSASTFTTNLTHAASWGTPAKHYYVSTLLGWTHWFGNTTEETKAYLQRAKLADATHPTGTVYYDANVDVRGETRSYQFVSASNELAGLGIASFILSNNPSPYSITNKPDILGAMMGAASPYIPAGSVYLPGSIAESLTSYSGILDNSSLGQFRMTQHLGVGVAGTSGTITEPYAVSSKFPAARLHAHYARGASLGEAFNLSVSQPYHLLIMGDALCRPHAIIPTASVAGLTEGAVVSGNVLLTPSGATDSPAGLSGFDLFVDGVLWNAVALGNSISLNTSALADGWHELRVVAYENSDIRTQGDLAVNFCVNNAGQAVNPAATNFTAYVGGGNLSLNVAAVGGTPAQIQIRKGETVVGTVAGASGTASIALTNLGPGRSVLRAVAALSSGLVRSVPILVDVLRATAATNATNLVFYAQVSNTNNAFTNLHVKPAYKDKDWMYFNVLGKDPLGLSDITMKVGNGSAAAFPLRWTGFSTTNRLPLLAGLTNPITYRYQLADTRDAEGLLPIELTVRAADGQYYKLTNQVATDFTPPQLSAFYVAPGIVVPGTAVRLTAFANEPVSNGLSLQVNGQPATLEGALSNRFSFRYTPTAGDALGTAFLTFSNFLDAAENGTTSFRVAYDFEAYAANAEGAALTALDPTWSVLSGSTNMGLQITHTNTAGGSTTAAVFRDVPTGMTNEIFMLDLPDATAAAAIEFDVFLDNRNSAGNVIFEVRPSRGTTSYREVALYLDQAATNSWRVRLLITGSATTVISTNLPLQTWHHIRFEDNVASNRASVYLDGGLLTNAVYTAEYNHLPVVDNFQLRSTGNDEDVFIDNVMVENLALPGNGPVISTDADGDGLPDDWERLYFGNLTAANATSDADRDGLSDLAEYLAGTHPLSAGSGLVLHLDNWQPLGKSNLATLSFSAVPGRVYDLPASPGLTNWTATTNWLATGTNLSLQVVATNTARGFWRVRVVP